MKSTLVNKKLYDNTLTNFELLLQLICDYIVLVTTTQPAQEKLTVKYFKDIISKFVKGLDELHLYDSSKIKVNKATKSEENDKNNIGIIIQVYIKETKDTDFSVLEFGVQKSDIIDLEKNG